MVGGRKYHLHSCFIYRELSHTADSGEIRTENEPFTRRMATSWCGKLSIILFGIDIFSSKHTSRKRKLVRLVVHTMHCFVLLTAPTLYVQSNIALHPRRGTGVGSRALLSYTNCFRDAVREDINDIITIVLDMFGPRSSLVIYEAGAPKFKDYIWYCFRETLI